MLVRSAKNKRWVPVKSLASLAEKAQFLHLAIPVAMFYLRELRDIVKSAESWTGTVRVSKELKRDLEWWQKVPNKHNGSPIFKAVETAYLHCDSNGFGWVQSSTTASRQEASGAAATRSITSSSRS